MCQSYFIFSYLCMFCHVKIGSNTVLQNFCQDYLSHSTWYNFFVMPHHAETFIRWVQYCSRKPPISQLWNQHASLCRFLVRDLPVCLQLELPSVCQSCARIIFHCNTMIYRGIHIDSVHLPPKCDHGCVCVWVCVCETMCTGVWPWVHVWVDVHAWCFWAILQNLL